MIMPSRPPRFSIQIRVDLLDTEVPVWRSVRVPGDLTLVGLHHVIQEAMGWSQAHLFQFSAPSGEAYQDYLLVDPEYAFDGLLDAGATPVLEAFDGDRGEMIYEYDFGDQWEHLVRIEDFRVEVWQGELQPKCLAGAGRCPPEDCGGAEGFAEMLEALADPDHEEHRSWMDWTGGGFDPTSFDVDRANVRLGELIECGWNTAELWRRRWCTATADRAQVEAAREGALHALAQGERELRRRQGGSSRPADPEGDPVEAAARLIHVTCAQRPMEVIRMRKPEALAAGALHAAVRMMRDPAFRVPLTSEPSPLSAQEAARWFGVSSATVSNWSRTAMFSLLEQSEEEAFAARAFMGGHPEGPAGSPSLERGGAA